MLAIAGDSALNNSAVNNILAMGLRKIMWQIDTRKNFQLQLYRGKLFEFAPTLFTALRVVHVGQDLWIND